MAQRESGASPTDRSPASQSVNSVKRCKGVNKETGKRCKRNTKGDFCSSHEGRTVSEESKKAGRDNLAKGRKKKQKMKEQAEAEGRTTRGERWAKLLDGSLTVKDMDDEELKRMAVRGKDGTFSGRKAAVPSHLAAAMQAEAIDRAQRKFRVAAPDAVAELLKIGADPDVKESDRIRALTYIIDRSLGKTPETIRVEGANLFDGVVGDAVGLNREIPDDASSLDGALDEEGAE